MGDLSNAIALVGRVPFLSADVAAIFSEMCNLAGKTSIASNNNNNNKQATSKHIAGSEARIVGFDDPKPVLVPAKKRGRAEKCAIFPRRMRLLGEARSS